MGATTEDHISQETARLVRAIVLLLLESRTPEDKQSKPESLLHRAGLSHKDIAALLGKKQDAVRKVIEREKP